MSQTTFRLSLAALTAMLAGCAGEASVDPTAPLPQSAESAPAFSVGAATTEGAMVAQLRQASVRFHDIQVAYDEGYVHATSTCNAGFGIVLRKLALYDAVIDPEHPELLLYAPQPNGNLHLAAVELLVLALPWDATHTDPPAYAGQAFEDRRAPGSAGPPFPNYALHAWIWQHNPAGMFTPYNPTVTCEPAP